MPESHHVFLENLASHTRPKTRRLGAVVLTLNLSACSRSGDQKVLREAVMGKGKGIPSVRRKALLKTLRTSLNGLQTFVSQVCCVTALMNAHLLVHTLVRRLHNPTPFEHALDFWILAFVCRVSVLPSWDLLVCSAFACLAMRALCLAWQFVWA